MGSYMSYCRVDEFLTKSDHRSSYSPKFVSRKKIGVTLIEYYQPSLQNALMLDLSEIGCKLILTENHYAMNKKVVDGSFIWLETNKTGLLPVSKPVEKILGFFKKLRSNQKVKIPKKYCRYPLKSSEGSKVVKIPFSYIFW